MVRTKKVTTTKTKAKKGGKWKKALKVGGAVAATAIGAALLASASRKKQYNPTSSYDSQNDGFQLQFQPEKAYSRENKHFGDDYSRKNLYKPPR